MQIAKKGRACVMFKTFKKSKIVKLGLKNMKPPRP
jgi:hypothetical protein